MSSPTPPALNDNILVLQLRAQWTLSDQGRGESSWSFIMLNAGVVTQKAMLWDMWEAAVKPHWMARRPTSWRFDQVLIEDRWPNDSFPLIIPLNEYGPGPSETSAPVQCTPVISWRTAYSGRSYRGRTYWGPFMRDDLDEAFVNNELVSELDDFINAMFSQFYVGARSETEPHFAIVSRQHDNAPSIPPRWADVNDVRIPHYLGIQRRRLQYWNL